MVSHARRRRFPVNGGDATVSAVVDSAQQPRAFAGWSVSWTREGASGVAGGPHRGGATGEGFGAVRRERRDHLREDPGIGGDHLATVEEITLAGEIANQSARPGIIRLPAATSQGLSPTSQNPS